MVGRGDPAGVDGDEIRRRVWGGAGLDGLERRARLTISNLLDDLFDFGVST